MAGTLERLEEKLAYLERHVAEQDKAMLEMSRDLDALRRELKILRERPMSRDSGDGSGAELDERPPHY